MCPLVHLHNSPPLSGAATAGFYKLYFVQFESEFMKHLQSDRPTLVVRQRATKIHGLWKYFLLAALLSALVT